MSKQPQIRKRNEDPLRRKRRNRGQHKKKHEKQRTMNQRLRHGGH